MGMESQDTAELAFDDCRIPAENLLGQEGMGFMMLMQQLQQERLCVAILSQASAEKVLEDAIAYTQERKAFGRSISKFQNTQFKLGAVRDRSRGRSGVPGQAHRTARRRGIPVKECSMAKLWQTEMQGRDRGRLPAALRRLRLHARVPDQPRVRGCPRAANLRRHQRNHEGDHRQADGALTRRWAAA